jgi:hypothetical protein
MIGSNPTIVYTILASQANFRKKRRGPDPRSRPSRLQTKKNAIRRPQKADNETCGVVFTGRGRPDGGAGARATGLVEALQEAGNLVEILAASQVALPDVASICAAHAPHPAVGADEQNQRI